MPARTCRACDLHGGTRVRFRCREKGLPSFLLDATVGKRGVVKLPSGRLRVPFQGGGWRDVLPLTEVIVVP